MREKVKTGVLLLLILLSFQLTRVFWLQDGAQASLAIVSPAGTLPPGETEFKSYLDLYRPLHIYAHSGNNHYQLRLPDSQYGAVWEEVKEALSKVAGTPGDPIVSSAAAWQQAASNSLELRYTGQVELNYWWLAANKSSFHRFKTEPFFFDRVLIPLHDNAIYFRNLQTNQVWRWNWSTEQNIVTLADLNQLTYSSSQRLRSVQVPEGVSVLSHAGLYVARRLTALPELMVAPPYRAADKSGIVRKFFSITPRMPKTEVLADGEVIESFITANQQVLKISNTGLLEYTETVSQPGAELVTLTQKFEQAFNFIGVHGGWPKSVLADGIRQVGSSGYEFRFMQVYQGYPLVDSRPATLSVQVASDGVKSYASKTYRVLQTGYFPYELRTPEDALQTAGQALGNKSVADIYLGYYQLDFTAMDAEQPFDTDPMYIFPVWVIELNNGEHLLVHAFSLSNDPGVIRPE